MKKIIIPILIMAFILIALAITLFLVKQRQDTRKKAAPATIVSLSPKTINKNVGDTFSVNVMVDTGENRVSAAEIHLSYPATILQGVSITPGSFLTKVLTPPAPTNTNGTASIILGVESSTNPATGQGVVAVATFKVLATSATPVKISIDSTSQVAAYGENNNVISSMQDATVTISRGNPTVSPTTTPTPTQQTTVTPTPTTRISGTVTPTPTETVEDEEEPEATNTPTPTTAANTNDTTSTPTPTSETTTTTFNSTTSTNYQLSVTNPSDGQIINSSKPVIKGTAKPGETIVITIHSEEQTITVVADENGNWSVTPKNTLEKGEHKLIVTAGDETLNANFTVGLPETATSIPTIILLTLGGAFLIFGLFKLKTI